MNKDLLNEAEKQLKRLRKTDNRVSSKCSSYVNAIKEIEKGKKLIEKNEFAKAAEYFSRAIELVSGNEQALINRGLCYFYLNQYDEAEKDFIKALSIEPDNAKTSYRYAELLLYKKDYRKVLKYANNSLNLYEDADSLYLRGLAYFYLDDLSRTKKDIKNAISVSSDKPKYYITMGNLCYQKYEFKDAINYLDTFIELSQSIDSKYSIFIDYDNNSIKSQYPNKHFMDSIEVSQMIDFANILKGKSYWKLGKFEKAKASFDKVSKSSSNKLEVYIGYSIYYLHKKDTQKTIEFANKALEWDKYSPRAIFLRGRALLIEKKYKNALYDFKNIQKVTPDRPVVYYYLGKCYEGLKKSKAAKNNYSIYLQKANSEGKDTRYKKEAEEYVKKN